LKYSLRQSASLGYIISAVFFFMAAIVVPDTVLADSIKLYTVDNYTVGSLSSTDLTGTTTKTNIEEIDQLYNLYMDKNIFPNLVLDAGGQFGRNNFVSKDDTEVHSAENQFSIFSDLRFNARPFTSTVGYYKRTDTAASLGSVLANTDERYSAVFGYRPEQDLPSFDFNYINDHNYDGRRILNDISTNDILMGLRYNPWPNLGLTYNLTYVDSFDNLRGSDSTLTTHSGRITYADSFFNRRVNVAATYDISDQTFETVSGQGETSVQIQLFPVHGLSGISDLANPTQTPTMITLSENPALIDGGMTASAGINLGLNSGLVTVPAPPRQEWNMGLDFVTATQTNALLVWVNKDLTKVADLFQWDVYTSGDNSTWTKKFTVTTAPGDFSTLPQPHFVIHLPSAITSRFVKVVVKPLDSTDQTTIIVRGLTPADFNDIAVTELQAVQVNVTSNQTKTSRSILTQHLNLNTRVKLLDSRDLFYDMTLFLANNSSSGGGASQTTAFLSNGLTFDQKFGGIFTFNARAARDDNYQATGHAVDYQYSAAISATPLYCTAGITISTPPVRLSPEAGRPAPLNRRLPPRTRSSFTTRRRFIPASTAF
jgi:hypothetical protein